MLIIIKHTIDLYLVACSQRVLALVKTNDLRLPYAAAPVSAEAGY